MYRMLLLLILIAGNAFGVNEQTLFLHVDKNQSPTTQDGLTWETAFTQIQPAIEAGYQELQSSSDYNRVDVWVAAEQDAEGYNENRTDLSPTGSLVMRQNVHLYGGFRGDEIAFWEREWREHATTINGDKARNGAATYHVIEGKSNSTLDGFTIKNGTDLSV